MFSFSKDIGMDLGTANTLVFMNCLLYTSDAADD